VVSVNLVTFTFDTEFMYFREQNESLAGSIRECRNSISKLSSGSSHKLDIFGRWMVTLVSAIKGNSGRFQKQPMGPLGSMITIKNQRWTMPIQKCVGIGNLCAFIVDNNNDAAILRQIMKDVFHRERAPFKFMPMIIQYHYTVSKIIIFVYVYIRTYFLIHRIVHTPVPLG